jgi:N-acetylglutamate synthase/N-acetylornithine aminotransferase
LISIIQPFIATGNTCTRIGVATINNQSTHMIIKMVFKGSGMIRPNMATMLSFIFTDVKATQSELQDCLTTATNQSLCYFIERLLKFVCALTQLNL